MSVNPFSADAAIRARVAALESVAGPAIRATVAEYFSSNRGDPDSNDGGVLPASEVEALCRVHGADVETLMLVLLKFAESFARPPISNFTVGAIGMEAGTGNLVFGGNLEFTVAHHGNPVHGEGFVLTRAFSRGTSIDAIAIGEAHPCAHCRQYLSEFAATSNLTLIDPLGHRLTMAQIYPWPFDPNYLGESGIVAGAVPYPDLRLGHHALAPDIARRLEATGRRSYSPYGKSPAAIVLSLADGRQIAGAVIESVAFNPTMSPLQAAMIDLFAHGYAITDIASAAIATRRGAAVDYVTHAVGLLNAIAPDLQIDCLEWA